MKLWSIAAAVLALTVVPAHAEDFDLEAGAKVFKKCAACHATGPDAKNKVGPILNGVVGRPWGVVEGYKYSADKEGTLLAVAADGQHVWTVPTLDDYFKKPKDLIPKGKMAFPGLPKDEDRRNVIAYLASFDADGNKVDPAPVLEANTPAN